MLTFTVRRWSLLGLAVALLFGVSAGGATAAGGQDLNRIPFDQPYISVLGASPAGVLYRVARELNEDPVIWLKPTGQPAYQVDGSFLSLAGDKIFGFSVENKVRYQLIGDRVTRSCDASPQPAERFRGGDTLSVFASFGWLSEDGDRVEAGADGCRVTAKYPLIGKYKLAALDSQGYVMAEQLGTDGRIQLIYRSYAEPTSPHVIADAGRNLYLSGVALAGKAVSWSQLDYEQAEPRASYIVRSSTDGSAAPVVTRVPYLAHNTAILGRATGWDGCYYGSTETCASGSIAADGTRTEVTGTRTVVSDGTRFVFDTYGTSPGVDAATTVGGSAPRTRIATVGLLPPRTRTVSLGAGGAAYVDNQPPAPSVSRRSYTRSGSGFTLSGQISLMHSTPVQDVSRDGRRTALVDPDNDLWLVTDQGVRTKVFDATDKVARVAEQRGLQLSGTRLLWLKGKYSGVICDPNPTCGDRYDNVVPMLYDLRTGVNTELPLSAWRPMALWGSYLVSVDAKNVISRQDLSSGRIVQVKPAGAAPVNSVAVNDDHVAWSTCTPNANGGCGRSTLAYRNLATGAAAVELASLHTQRVRLSGGHVVYDVYSSPGSGGTLKVLRLGTRATGVVAPVFPYRPFDVHDETLAWIAPDEVARIGPNSPFVAPPRYLGNALGPAGFTPNGDGVEDTWTPEFSISKALPSCAVTIRTGTTVRRVLPCGSTTGAARPLWDGRDSAGKALPKGTYTWTLTGSDADGTLRWWTNATHPITGTVRIA